MRRLALVTACAATLTPTGAWAGGFEGEYPDNGARALGRGGAFVAKADDPTALYYNPAGLGLLRGTNLLLSVNLVDVTHSFQRAPDIVQTNVRRSFGPIETDSAPFPAPMLIGHFDFEALPMLDFAVGVYGPSSHPNRSFPSQFPIASAVREVNGMSIDRIDKLRGVRDDALAPNGLIVESQMLLAYPTVSVAWTVTDQLRLGVSLQAAMMQATIKKAIGGVLPAVTELEFHDYFTPTGIIGVHYAPTSFLEFGFSLRPPISVEAEGTVTATRFAQCARGPCGTPEERADEPLGPYPLEGEQVLLDANGQPADGVTFDFDQPMITRLGVRYVHRVGEAELFDVEFDYVHSLQSVHESFVVGFDATQTVVEGLADPIPVPGIEDARNYQDTHGFRLGGDYAVLPDLLTLRLGGTYETGASPDAYTTLDFPGLDQWSIAGGFGLSFDLVSVDVGYTYVGLIDRTVTDSEAPLEDLQKVVADEEKIGNGTFSGHYHVFGLSTTWHL